MQRLKALSGASVLVLLGAASTTASAAPTLRVQVDQNGDFIMVGNTLGHDCRAAVATPIIGTVGAVCGVSTGDSSPDLFWASNDANGTAAANVTVSLAEAQSTAQLNIPPGANVTHAFLYWGARRTGATADTTVTFGRPGVFSSNLNADGSFAVAASGTQSYYQSVVDVTGLIQANGSGPYRVSGVDSLNFVNLNDNVAYAGWSLVVLYEDPLAPLRNLAIFDGLDLVDGTNSQSANLSGFLVPNAGFDAKLGVLTYEGDNTATGDALRFGTAPLNNGDRLSDASNPNNNFFNSSRSFLGVPVSNVGDLPQLTGGPDSLSSFDIDVVDITSRVTPGQTSADIEATTSGDVYLLGAFITSISTYKPDFSTSTKSVTDLNGGGIVVGDELQFTIQVVNTGNDTATNVVLTDLLPTGVTYVSNSLEITAGPNAGTKTDGAGDDQAEFNAGTAVFRLGTGANAATGGQLAVGGTSTVTFRVTVDAGTGGTSLENQAVISSDGLLGAPTETYPTDGNGNGPGTPPTPIDIDECVTDNDCVNPTPFCQTALNPNLCVECLGDSDCSPLTPTCDGTFVCVCIPTSATEICTDNIDNDCNGVINDGCADSDNDGLPDDVEILLHTDPNDADSDDDGVIDGDEPDFDQDTDGDGLINALDPDSDNDGLLDGTELGLPCTDPATDVAAGHCVADGDAGATTTDPLNADTDNGGVSDGSEDSNLNGVVDAGEGDPNVGADDAGIVDSDDDGLSDDLEVFLGSDPLDADTDDDGVLDGDEANPSDDTDGDGLVNVIDVDSDNDGLYDGTERGTDCNDPATDPGPPSHCIADGDAGATVTSMVNADTDYGGVSDGNEDSNLNGVIDGGETNPNTGIDDGVIIDSDNDGLSDDLEGTLGTSPTDADSDDDGVLDGDEPNPNDDADGDGNNNANDADSDGDGLFDGLELGNDCDDPATDPASNTCTPDGDAGATTTHPLIADTDGGGVIDGDEDTNKNGVVDPGERDPNDPTDDIIVAACDDDSDCGAVDSGLVCDAGTCVMGCRGLNGNGCPDGFMCTSDDEEIGECVPEEPMGGAGGDGAAGGAGGAGADGGAGGSGGQATGNVYAEGNGLFCAVGNSLGDNSPADSRIAWLLGLSAAVWMQRRRAHAKRQRRLA